MQLSSEQRNFFETFGYLAFPKLFAAEEIGWIAEEFEKSVTRWAAKYLNQNVQYSIRCGFLPEKRSGSEGRPASF